MEWYCAKKSCPYDGEKPFVLRLKPETCVDKNNIATMFCPHCNSKLKEREEHRKAK